MQLSLSPSLAVLAAAVAAAMTAAVAGPLAAQEPAAKKALWEVFAADDLADLQRRTAADAKLRDSRDDCQQTLLHQAVDRNARRCAEWLLAQGANVDATAYNDFSPLHLAAARGFVDTIKLLLKHGAKLEVRASFGPTPLQYAAQSRQRAAVELLRNAGAVYDLDTAVMLADVPWVERCLAAGDTVVTPEIAEHAVRTGNLAIVRLVVPQKSPRRAPPPGPPPPPLHFWALPHPEVLAWFFDEAPQRADARAPIAWGPGEALPLLHLAVQRDNTASIDVLLAHGVELDGRAANGTTALQWAAQHAAPNALAALLAKGAKVDAAGPNPLTLATRGIYHGAEAKEAARRRECADVLLARGAPIELDAAMALGRLDDVDRLLRATPALATAPEPHPVLVRAAKHANVDLLARLLAAGAPVASADTNHDTALHWSAMLGSLPCVELLLERAAPLTGADYWGFTPLHEAVRSGHVEVAARLLRAGADRDARDRDGKRALELAPAAQRAAFEQAFAKR